MMLRLHAFGRVDDLEEVLINSDHIVFVFDCEDFRALLTDSIRGVLRKQSCVYVSETLGEIENMMNRKVY